MQDFSEIQTRIHMLLDAASNGEDVNISDELIEEAGENFKKALKRQFSNEARQFKLRMSNIGRPSCQLQMEQAETEKSRMPYNHVIRMLIGDAVEAAIGMVLKASGVNLTDEKSRVSMDINGQFVDGEIDFEIDDEVWDVKSASPYAFMHKFSNGFNGVYYNDTFGYVAQLYGYAKAKGKKMGGWIVVDKSSGEVVVIKATPTKEQLEFIEANVGETVDIIANNEPFRKRFREEVELFRGKPTGNTIVPVVCTFCSYMHKCWPDAKMMPKAGSKAQQPKPTWYVDYKNA